MVHDPAAEPPPPATIQKLASGVFPSFAMLAGMQTGIFTALDEAPLSAAEAARKLDVKPARLGPLLYALVAAGLLELRAGRFANTAESAHYLVQGAPAYLGDMHLLFSDIWSATLSAGASILKGAPQAKHDFSEMSEDDLYAFLNGMAGATRASGQGLAKHHDFSACRRLADVGGGSGALAIALCEAYSALAATVVELAQVVPVARRLVAEAGFAARVTVEACDLTRAPLSGGYDAVVMRSFLQVLSPDQAGAAVANAASGLVAGGHLYVIGIGVLEDSRLAPAQAVGINLAFLSVYDHGRSYTVGEHTAWFEAAGLGAPEHTKLPGGLSMLDARKPD